MSQNNSACQRFNAQYVPLVQSSAAGAGTAGVNFKVPVPDSRLRTKISLLFVPNAGSTLLSSLSPANATLWLFDGEQDQSGLSGIILPAADIEGTSGAPTAIPLSAGLYGYSREFTTSADAIEGAFNCTTNGVQAGTWVLQVRYTPDSVRFEPAEWNEITRGCTPSRTSPLVKL